MTECSKPLKKKLARHQRDRVRGLSRVASRWDIHAALMRLRPALHLMSTLQLCD